MWSMTPAACSPIFRGWSERGPRILFVVSGIGAPARGLPLSSKKPSHTELAPRILRMARHGVTFSGLSAWLSGVELASMQKMVATFCDLAWNCSQRLCSLASPCLSKVGPHSSCSRMASSFGALPLARWAQNTVNSTLSERRLRSTCRAPRYFQLLAKGTKCTRLSSKQSLRQKTATPSSSQSSIRPFSTAFFPSLRPVLGRLGRNATPLSSSSARKAWNGAPSCLPLL
mmetsp:Transcript_15686/g.41539  ORF Transcript_15686/g.41539 Transcript_15686/m.41539 type:complete len:229 (+) Transcript_15686:263-949(+)